MEINDSELPDPLLAVVNCHGLERQVALLGGKQSALAELRKYDPNDWVPPKKIDGHGNYDDAQLNAFTILLAASSLLANAITIKQYLDSPSFKEFTSKVKIDCKLQWNIVQNHISVVCLLCEHYWPHFKDEIQSNLPQTVAPKTSSILRLPTMLISMLGTCFVAPWVIGTSIHTSSLFLLWSLIGLYIYSAFSAAIPRELIITQQLNSISDKFKNNGWFKAEDFAIPLHPNADAIIQRWLQFATHKKLISEKKTRIAILPSLKPETSQIVATRPGMNDYLLLHISAPDENTKPTQYNAMRAMWLLAHEFCHPVNPSDRVRQAFLPGTILTLLICLATLAFTINFDLIACLAISLIILLICIRALVVELLTEAKADDIAIVSLVQNHGVPPHLLRNFLLVEQGGIMSGRHKISLRSLKLLVRHYFQIRSTESAAIKKLSPIYSIDFWSQLSLTGLSAMLAFFMGTLYHVSNNFNATVFIAAGIITLCALVTIGRVLQTGKQVDSIYDKLPTYTANEAP